MKLEHIEAGRRWWSGQRWSLALLVFGVSVTAAARPAAACGGFFCDNATPVNQAAERIIFSVHDDGTVTAVVQIVYSGPAERFAWVLPVPGQPDISVASNIALQRLQQATNPNYQLRTEVRGACLPEPSNAAFASQAGAAEDGGGGVAPSNSGVQVLDQGSVGPYDYVLISAQTGTPDVADVVVDWLQTNGYDVAPTARETLGPYLADGMNLVAFRLTKGSDSGEIRPVVLRYAATQPMIPIRPTAVAANNDMGVMVWVLGPHRAVPLNYFALEINEARLNWFNPNSNYNDVIIAAANEAGGHGFVTEQAGAAPVLGDTVFSLADEQTWSTRFVGQDWSGRQGALIEALVRQYRGWDGLRRAIDTVLPLPPGVSVDDVLACPSCVSGQIPSFVPTALLTAVEQEVIVPMRHVRDLFRTQAYTTRLYTTLSPAEMDVDPRFDFNPDLPAHSNVHVQTRVIKCDGRWTRSAAPWFVALDSGLTVYGRGNQWPVDSTLALSMPANQRILQLSTAGPGTLIRDYSAEIQAQLDEGEAGSAVGLGGGGGHCQLGQWTRTSLMQTVLLLAVLLLGLRRRWPRPGV
ncbi:MAG: DUF2330 domain-containing protein [Polyangiales bacterium]